MTVVNSSLSYHWPRPPHITAPLEAQVKTVEALVQNPKFFVLNDIGLGKTYTALWAQDILRQEGVVKRVLIVVPKSPMGNAWMPSIPTVVRDFTKRVVVLADMPSKERQRLYSSDWDIALINPEALYMIERELPPWGNPDLIIVDESTMFKNWRSKRTKALRTLADKSKGLWLMSADPAPESPLDLWAQIKLIAPERVPLYYGQWQELTMRQVTQFKWVPRPNATDVMARALEGISIRFRRDQCLDLPPLQHLDVVIEPTSEFNKIAAQLKADAVAVLSDPDKAIVARNAASMISKLLQAASGCVNVESELGEKSRMPVDCGPRFDLLHEMLSCSNSPVMVMSAFTAGLDVVEEWMQRQGMPCVRVDGGVSVHDRQEAFQAVQNKSVKALLGQPAAMAHGVTLTSANGVFWWSLPMAREHYHQTIGRITRSGQTQNMLVLHPVSCPVEKKVLELLRSKEAFGQGLLQIVEQFGKLL